MVALVVYRKGNLLIKLRNNDTAKEIAHSESSINILLVQATKSPFDVNRDIKGRKNNIDAGKVDNEQILTGLMVRIDESSHGH